MYVVIIDIISLGYNSYILYVAIPNTCLHQLHVYTYF